MASNRLLFINSFWRFVREVVRLEVDGERSLAPCARKQESAAAMHRVVTAGGWRRNQQCKHIRAPTPHVRSGQQGGPNASPALKECGRQRHMALSYAFLNLLSSAVRITRTCVSMKTRIHAACRGSAGKVCTVIIAANHHWSLVFQQLANVLRMRSQMRTIQCVPHARRRLEFPAPTCRRRVFSSAILSTRVLVTLRTRKQMARLRRALIGCWRTTVVAKRDLNRGWKPSAPVLMARHGTGA